MAKNTRKIADPDIQLNIDDRIRQRAYELYQERGGADGYDVDDWLQAEEELRGNYADKAAA